MIATFLFVLMILGSTAIGAPAAVAGLAIGLALVAIHLIGIPITGTSVNPARSIGPALLVGGQAMAQLWLFVSSCHWYGGGALAGVVHRVLIGWSRRSSLIDFSYEDDALGTRPERRLMIYVSASAKVSFTTSLSLLCLNEEIGS